MFASGWRLFSCPLALRDRYRDDSPAGRLAKCRAPRTKGGICRFRACGQSALEHEFFRFGDRNTRNASFLIDPSVRAECFLFGGALSHQDFWLTRHELRPP